MEDEDLYTIYCLGSDRKVLHTYRGAILISATKSVMQWFADGGADAIIEHEKSGIKLTPEITFRRLDVPTFKRNKVVID